jgi:phosphate butyryltransferase
MTTIAEIIAAAVAAAGRPRLAVAAAADPEVLRAVEDARRAGLADAVLFAGAAELRAVAAAEGIDLAPYRIVDLADPAAAAAAAVAAVRSGEAEILMKGLLDTAQLLKAALNKEAGLGTGRLLSHVGVLESPYYRKLLLLSDAAINIAPVLAEKADIIRNAAGLARALGIAEPKVAVLAAVEKVNAEKMPCTADAALLTQMNRRGQISGCLVDGPLALDNAVSAEAARIKGIGGPVAGDADILLAPDIEAGNLLYKALIDLGGAKGAGLVLGAAVPIVLTSRSDTAETKLASIALAVLAGRGAAGRGTATGAPL